MRGSTAGLPERRQLDYSLESRVARKRRKVGGDGLSDDVASGDWFDFPFEFLTPSGDDTAPCRSRAGGERRLHFNDARDPDATLTTLLEPSAWVPGASFSLTMEVVCP